MTDPEKSKSRPVRKLTEADVLEIVARCESGEAQAAVARDFPVTTGMVGAIVRGIAWSHLTGIEPHKRGYARGEASGNAKLTRSQVLEIVRRCRAGEPPVSVARDFPVNKYQVNVIMRGGSWSHLTGIKRGKGYLRGEDAANAKLTEADVLEIVRRYEAGETQTSIARDFPVKRNQVSQIVIGKAWVHVTGIKRRRGRRLGEDVPTAKLTEPDVLEIVRRYEAGENHTSIARDFPVNRDQVSKIVNGKAWVHVTGIQADDTTDE